MFDNIISNFGSAFDHQSSVFTCPVTGVYMFGVNVMSTPAAAAQVSLFIDDNSIFNVLADGVSGAYVTASNFAFVSCERGKSVWIKTFQRTNQEIHPYRYTTFSGFLISV